MWRRVSTNCFQLIIPTSGRKKCFFTTNKLDARVKKKKNQTEVI